MSSRRAGCRASSVAPARASWAPLYRPDTSLALMPSALESLIAYMSDEQPIALRLEAAAAVVEIVTGARPADPAHVVRAALRVAELAEAMTPPKATRPRCGARTRAGASCQARGYRRPDGTVSARCRMHGGASTGPRTPEGRARCAEAARRRWKAYRARKRAEEDT